MFIVIHGEDQAKSRGQLLDLINKSKAAGISDISNLDGKSVNLETVIQNLESLSLLGPIQRLTVIEDLHRRRSKTELKEIVDYIASQDEKSLNLILWEGRELTAAQLKKFVKARIIYSKLPASIFKLTDSLTPSADIGELIRLFHQASMQESSELVLIMIARHLKMMIQSFDPDSRLPPWQKVKITSTAKQFGLEKLILMHHQLCEIDIANKTGKLPLDLKSEIEQWLISSYIS